MQLNARVVEQELCMTVVGGERLGEADEELGGSRQAWSSGTGTASPASGEEVACIRH